MRCSAGQRPKSRRSCAGLLAASCGRARSSPLVVDARRACGGAAARRRTPCRHAARRSRPGGRGDRARRAWTGRALEQFRLEVGRPVQPMLAQTAADVAEALERSGPAAVEWKLDGIRVQVHKHGDDVRVFTRTPGRDHRPAARGRRGRAALCRARPPCSTARRSPCGPDGRPLPFQETGTRVGSTVDVERPRADRTAVAVRLRCPARRRRGPARRGRGASGRGDGGRGARAACGCRGW